MHPFIQEARSVVAARVQSYLDDAGVQTLSFEPWGPDLRARLRDYALRGKLIRGAMVGLGYRVFRPHGDLPSACADAGAAMELLQSFLLIHDDIMDQDDTRRGGPAVHAQYRDETPTGRERSRYQYGLSMGICAGDVSAFLAIHLLSQLEAPTETRGRITELTAREITLCGLAQMQDVHHGYVDSAEDAAILNVYTYKTGRYTFSLPLMIGAILAGADDQALHGLGRLGEQLGRIFQIRDDQLGIFGSEEQTGKPVGSDIREDKKTLFRNGLVRKLGADEPARQAFGSNHVDQDTVDLVRTALHEQGILAAVETVVSHDADSARDEIRAISAPPEGKEALTTLLEYNLRRAV